MPAGVMEAFPSRIIHVPVLLEEVIRWLEPHPGGRYLDATVGLGGHAEEILKQSSPDGILYGLDWDSQALAVARLRLKPFSDRTILLHGSFKDLDRIAEEYGLSELDGLLFDLGLSALQLEDRERGFAFSRDGPLDMRMDRRLKLTASDLVNELSEKELACLLLEFGEERHARRIARRIVQARKKEKIVSTNQLAEIVRLSLPPRARHTRIHPATRTFQALRIAVNRELEGLDRSIQIGFGLLRSGGRMAIISYHSLEDRIVKRTLRSLSQSGGLVDILAPPGGKALVLTKKPVTPAAEEVVRNPRSRSAKLRVAEKR